MSLADGDDAVMDEGAVGPTGAAASAASSSRAAAAAANSYADLPALTSTPVVADLALTQGLTQDKEAGGGVSNLVDVLRQVWINERGERQDGWMRWGWERVPLLPPLTFPLTAVVASAVAAAAPELLNYEQNVVDDVKAAVDQRVRRTGGSRLPPVTATDSRRTDILSDSESAPLPPLLLTFVPVSVFAAK